MSLVKKPRLEKSRLHKHLRKSSAKSKGEVEAERRDRINVHDVKIQALEGTTQFDSGTASDEDSNVANEEANEVGTKHLNVLKKLKECDPEFYKFLQDEDADLLQFQISDEDEEEDDGIEHGKTAVGKPSFPKGKKDNSGRIIFDGRMLDYLHDVLDTQDEVRSILIEDIRLAVEAFNACVSRVGADIEMPKYVINEQAVFYGTVRLCFEKLGNIFTSLISDKVKVNAGSTTAAKSKRTLKYIKKYQAPLKQYLSSVLTFVNEVQASDIIVTTLKAILRIVDLYALFKRLTKKLSKVLVRIWSRKTLDCRVGAYVCMTKLVKNHPEHFVVLYKCCYLGFVSNSRVVTNTTWPLLHFAHRTFAELTVLHPNLAYPYAFVYIRQIAIHLRNATISKKRKDMVQTVYNWQVMQCLYLWTRVVSKAHFVNDCEAISELTYPLIQVIYGILKLYQSLRYIPLRLHCISLLIQLQANCEVYVPTMTFAVELMSDVELILTRKPKALKSVKVLDIDCSLKVNAFVLEEISWRKSLCEHLFRILLQAAHLVCAQPCFPDVIVPITFRVRNLLRRIRSGEFVRCFRALLEKLEEHAKYIADVLLIREFKLKDDMQILALKSGLSDPNSPFRIYYRQWENVWRIRQGAQGSTTKAEENDSPAKGKPLKRKREVKEVKEASNIVNPKKIHKPAVTPRVPKDETIPDEFGDLGNWSDSD